MSEDDEEKFILTQLWNSAEFSQDTNLSMDTEIKELMLTNMERYQILSAPLGQVILPKLSL